MEVSKHDPFVVWFDNALKPDFCEKVIEKFNKDDRQQEGVVGGGYRPEIKQSMDLQISHLEDWKEEDDVFFKSLNTSIQTYANYCMEKFNQLVPLDIDTGYQIQRTKPEGFYHWHHDFMLHDTNLGAYRSLTYIWYLNTPEEGQTEFVSGEAITPETGKLVLFPATWDRVHRGTPPKSVKYLCTGWMYGGIEDQEEEEQPIDDMFNK